MTKKQIAALTDIITSAYAIHKEDVGGERTNGKAYQVSDGYMGVIYHEEIPADQNPYRKRTVFNELMPYEPEECFVYNMIRRELDGGDYYLITSPCSGEIQLSKFPSQIRAAQFPSPSGGGIKVVELAAVGEDGTEMKGIFDVRLVRLAVDAVGGKPRLYIGNNLRNHHPYHFLIVDSGPSICDPDQNNMAIVMPIANKKYKV